MFHRPLVAAALLAAACGGLALGLGGGRDPRRLPGIQPGGEVLLPNGWSLRPAGKQVPLGDFPVNLALHPSGRWLAVLHAGFGPHEVMVLDLQGGRQKVTCRVPVDQAVGLHVRDRRQVFGPGHRQRPGGVRLPRGHDRDAGDRRRHPPSATDQLAVRHGAPAHG